MFKWKLLTFSPKLFDVKEESKSEHEDGESQDEVDEEDNPVK